MQAAWFSIALANFPFNVDPVQFAKYGPIGIIVAALLFSCFLLYAVFSKNKTDRRALYLYLIFSTIVIAIGSISEYARDLSVEYADSLKSKLEEQTILNIKLRERISQLLDLIGEIDEKNSTIGIY